MNKKLVILTLTFSLTIILFFSCRKDPYPLIPNVYVNLHINVNSALYNDLNSVGGYIYLTGGNKGIIVYRNSIDEFKAFERTCPYDPDAETARIVVDQSRLFAVDSTCTSEFLLLDGSVHNGPSTLPLKQYKTSFDGEILHIYN